MIENIDFNIGRIRMALKEMGIDRETYLMFFSDHGELLGDYGMFHKLPAFYDCLTKIPVILRHPEGKWKGRRFAGLVEQVDLAPTLLEMLGIPIPKTMVGKSWAQALDVGDDTGRETALCEAGAGAPTWKNPDPELALSAPHAPTSFGPGAMLRWKNWKLSVYADDTCELFDLEKDPSELRNLHGNSDFAEVQNHMTALLLKRVLGVKMRDTGLDWDMSEYPVDVRFEPLEIA